jgi:ankyrin repeat protein
MSNTGFSALIIASAHGHSDAVKYLINEAKANVNLVHENKVTSLMYAAASGKVDTMKVLLEDGKVDVNALHTNGGSALIEACTAGASEAIAFLVENGAKYDIIDNDGVTPLMAIAAQGNLAGVTSILNKLKNDMNAEQLKDHINLFSFSGGSAVMFAAAGGHSEAMATLIDLGADVNAIAQATPDYLVKLAKMIEDGSVNDEDPHVDGVTATHVAAQGGHLESVKMLINAKTDAKVILM